MSAVPDKNHDSACRTDPSVLPLRRLPCTGRQSVDDDPLPQHLVPDRREGAAALVCPVAGDIDSAMKACDQQRGSLANIIRAGLERYQNFSSEVKAGESQKLMAEVQRAIEEASALEMPILEKNLIAMSTIASVSTMFGLLGTVLGMIRSFRALAVSGGAPDAIGLSIGISEALINTALGLFAAIIGIVAYNFFVNKVDNFTYMIDEASYDVIQTLTTRAK